MEIIPHIHRLPLRFVNIYLIVMPEGAALIDAGMPGSQKQILAYLARLGLGPADLKYILITHADIDHYGSLNALEKLCAAQVCASELEAQAMRAGQSSRALKVAPLLKPFFKLIDWLYPIPPARVDTILHDNEVLPILGGLRVIATPGHTPGHTSYYLEEAGVLFCGDSIVCHSHQLRLSSGMNNWDAAASRASGQRQASLGARILCSGHGEIMNNLPVDWKFNNG